MNDIFSWEAMKNKVNEWNNYSVVEDKETDNGGNLIEDSNIQVQLYYSSDCSCCTSTVSGCNVVSEKGT